VVGDILQPTHLIFILVVALLVLGPKRLPEVGRSLGRGLRDFRAAMTGEEIERHEEVMPATATDPTRPAEEPDGETAAAAPARQATAEPSHWATAEPIHDATVEPADDTASAPAHWATAAAPAPAGPAEAAPEPSEQPAREPAKHVS
jgi:TatA/E family protein of Tat protein translocase